MPAAKFITLQDLRFQLAQPPHASLPVNGPLLPLPCSVTTTTAAQSTFYTQYRGDLVLFETHSISTLNGIYPLSCTEDGSMPIYIYIPLYMPSPLTPWVVSLPPIRMLGVGDFIDVPVLGCARVRAIISEDRESCTFKATLRADRSTIYLQCRREWTSLPPWPVRRMRALWGFM